MNFIKTGLFVALSLLFVVSAQGNCFKSCSKPCARTCETKPECKLPIKPVAVAESYSCGHPGFVRKVCRLEYRPAEGHGTEKTVMKMPIYEGCFVEGDNGLEPDTDGNFANTQAVNTSAAYSAQSGVSVGTHQQRQNVRGMRNSRKNGNGMNY